MHVVLWVLLFWPLPHTRSEPVAINNYPTQRQCEDVLDAIVRNGLAVEREVQCVKRAY